MLTEKVDSSIKKREKEKKIITLSAKEDCLLVCSQSAGELNCLDRAER